MNFEEKKPGVSPASIIRKAILIVVLLLVIGVAVYDFGFVQPNINDIQTEMTKREGGLAGPETIQELAKKEPEKTERIDGAHVETYTWNRPIPFMKVNLYAIYKVTTVKEKGKEDAEKIEFVKVTRNLEDEELPEPAEVTNAVAAIGGVGGGGARRNRNPRPNPNKGDQKNNEKSDAKKADDKKTDNEDKANENKADENKDAGKNASTNDDAKDKKGKKRVIN